MNVEKVDIDTALARAEALRRERNYTGALAILLDLARKAPDDPHVAYAIASNYDPQGMEEEAIPHYERALANGLNGEDLRGCLLGLGSSYRCMERYADAVRTLQRGAAAFPDAHEFDVFLAIARYNTGEHSEAMRLLLSHIAQHTSDHETRRYARAISYYADHLDPPYEI